MNPRAKHAIRGAFLAYFVDMFDIYLPIVVLAPVLTYFVAPDLGATATAIVGASIFAVTLIGRPLGAGIFGHFADTIGRKRTAMISITGFGVATLLMALLPGYQQWGIAAVILFIALRFVDGIFLGGEYTAANPLAMEYSPKEKRGLYSAVINCAFPLAYASIALITLLLLFLMPSEKLDAPYVQWGWRIPFFIGAALAFAFAIYYYHAVSESELWQGSEHTEAPIKQLFRGENLRSFLQVFVLMSGLCLALQTVAAILPGVLGGPVGFSSTNVTVTLVVAYLVLIPANIVAGLISQRIGRRTFLIAMGAIIAIVATLLYYLLISNASESYFGVVLLTVAIVALVDSPFALTPAYINERFHIGVRASGYGLGYSLAVILPSFYAFYQAGLATFMPFEYTVLVLVVVGGLLIAIGAAWGPETKDVDFSADAKATTEERAHEDESL
nr:MFS transporter [Rubrobacter xylanophilus]